MFQWNNHGYDIAKIFSNKFTHISPVWLQIKFIDSMKYEVTGTHDVDANWLNDVRNNGRKRGVKSISFLLFNI